MDILSYIMGMKAAGGSGGGPDLSNDTVTADSLLDGITAHDAQGEAITGTLTGEDFLQGRLTVTSYYFEHGHMLQTIAWNNTNKLIQATSTSIPYYPEEGAKTIKIPIGMYSYFFISTSDELEFENVSSRVKIAPIAIEGMTGYIIRVGATKTVEQTFTISAPVSE